MLPPNSLRHPEPRKRGARFQGPIYAPHLRVNGQISARVGVRDLLLTHGIASYVYTMGSTSRPCSLHRSEVFYMRVWQHKNNQRGYFTKKYKRYGVPIDFSKVKT